ncbi:MAG: PD-(D/E)XK nuclease family transposase [Erysipelotrichaceae bacterium]|nr:PD-(D/E)XK nuclease family transposase [Erysipelotrichaceae bacterium]
MIVKCIIEETTGIKVSSLTLSSNDIKPHGKEGKLNRVDFHVIDEDGRHYDIEMENGPYNEENNVCFETYACKLISSQETRIKDYDTIDSVYQIVFFKGRKATDNTRKIERYCVYETENPK